MGTNYLFFSQKAVPMFLFAMPLTLTSESFLNTKGFLAHLLKLCILKVALNQYLKPSKTCKGDKKNEGKTGHTAGVSDRNLSV